MATTHVRGMAAALALLGALVACSTPAEPDPPKPSGTKKPAAPRASTSPKATPAGSGSAKPSANPSAGASGSPRPSPTPTGATGGGSPTPVPTGSAFVVTSSPTPLPTPTGPVVVAGAVTTAANDRSAYPDPAPDNVPIAVPAGLTIDPAGRIYVADQRNHRIRLIDPAAGTVRTFAGGGTVETAAGSDDGPLAKARFRLPVDVVRAASGRLYVADGGNAAIRMIDPDAKTVATVVADSATEAGTPKLGQLRRMAIDPAGDVLYVAGASAIFKVEPSKTPVAITKLVDMIADGLAFDPRGALVFVSREGHAVRRLDLKAAGAVPTLLAGGAQGKADGQGAAATFDNPEGVAVDPQGVCYLADAGNDLIRRISPTGLVDTLAGGGTGAVPDGTGKAAVFDEPLAIAIGPTGALYVSEGSGLIRIIK